MWNLLNLTLMYSAIKNGYSNLNMNLTIILLFHFIVLSSSIYKHPFQYNRNNKKEYEF